MTTRGELRDLLRNRQMPDHARPNVTLGEIRALIPEGAVLVTEADLLQIRALVDVALDIELDASAETWATFRHTRNRVGRALSHLRDTPS
jgi:hypothetical protein